jgi:hypothetical protein
MSFPAESDTPAQRPPVQPKPATHLEDTVDGLRGILDASFRDVEIEVAGSAALFSATAPRA